MIDPRKIPPNLNLCRTCPRHDYGTIGVDLCREPKGARYNTKVIDECFNIPSNCEFKLDQMMDYEEALSENWQTMLIDVVRKFSGQKRRREYLRPLGVELNEPNQTDT